MDEQKLAELFRETAGAAPPASFDEQDVTQGSRRVTARRRMAAAGGTMVAAAVLVGGVGAGTGMFEQNPSTMQAGSAHDQRSSQESVAPRSPGTLMEPAEPVECGPPDDQLAQALASRVPEAAGRRPDVAENCPRGSRAAAFTLQEGSTRGNVSVILAPRHAVPQAETKSGRQPDGTGQAVETAHSGKVLLVRSDPADDSPAPPLHTRLPSIAKDLAGRF